MVFYHLLDRALEGCGTTRRREQNSIVFQQRARVEKHTFRGSAQKSALPATARRLKLHFRACGAEHQNWLSQFDTLSESLPQQDLEKRIWLRHLGYLLARESATHLPETERAGLAAWNGMDSSSQLIVMRRLTEALRPMQKSSCWLIDRLTPRLEQVLPIHFGDHEPSCLGKANIVAGAAYLAGTPAVLSVPVVMQTDHFADHFVEAIASFERFIQNHPVVLADFRSQKTLHRQRCRYLQESLAPSWMHGCVSLFGERGTLQCDPNFGRYGEFALSPFTTRRLLAKCNRMTPGVPPTTVISMAHQYEPLKGEFQTLLSKCETLADCMAANLAASDAVLVAAIEESIAELELLPDFASFFKKIDCKEADPLLLRKLICLLADQPWDQLQFASRNQLDLCMPSNKFLRLICQRIPFCLAFQGYQKVEERIVLNQKHAEAVAVEHHPAHFALGVYTLRHVAAAEGMLFELAPELVHYCAGQFLLWDSVCALEHESSAIASHNNDRLLTGRYAATLLDRLHATARLKSANRGLEGFLERLTLSNPSVHKKEAHHEPREHAEPEPRRRRNGDLGKSPATAGLGENPG